MKNSQIYPWTARGGKWFGGESGWGVLWMTRWSTWCIGFEVFRFGIIFFVGPIMVGIGNAVDDETASPIRTNETEGK
jgi:hypothetical protein